LIDRRSLVANLLHVCVPTPDQVNGGTCGRGPPHGFFTDRAYVDGHHIVVEQERFGGIEPESNRRSSQSKVIDSGHQVFIRPSRELVGVGERGDDLGARNAIPESVRGGRYEDHFFLANRGAYDASPVPQHEVRQGIVRTEKHP